MDHHENEAVATNAASPCLVKAALQQKLLEHKHQVTQRFIQLDVATNQLRTAHTRRLLTGREAYVNAHAGHKINHTNNWHLHTARKTQLDLHLGFPSQCNYIIHLMHQFAAFLRRCSRLICFVQLLCSSAYSKHAHDYVLQGTEWCIFDII